MSVAVQPALPAGFAVDRLRELEYVIERGLETFVDVGVALTEIRDSRLYRKTHSTFEGYCRERWAMNDRRASQFIRASQVVRELPTNVGIPKNEATARELAPLLDQPDVLREVWTTVVSEHDDPTAKDVREQLRKTTVLLTSSESVEWYTPVEYIAMAREVLGVIDLDPASCELANETVEAGKFYSEDDDGLARDWFGRVWLNPPYGKRCASFVDKLRLEYDSGNVSEAILLVNAYATETRWFQPLLSRIVCFPNRRLSFNSPSGRGKGGATFGSAFVYFGRRPERFLQVFGKAGVVVTELNAEHLLSASA